MDREEVLPFKVWKIDTKVRPCFGTREKDANKKYRCDVGEVGTEIQRRVIEILETLKRVDLPLNIGAMTYSNKKWMSSGDGFHIKYAMPPYQYLKSFWPNYYMEEIAELIDPTKTPDEGDLAESFAIDYYGKDLHLLCKYKETDVAYMGDYKVLCIRAKNSLLKGTGPIVLWKREALTCADLTDEHLRDFEKAIVSIFGKRLSGMKENVEDFGFSVCIFVTEHNECPSEAKICIGAKIDEKRFIETINPPKEIKESFLKEHKYVEKNIKYQKKEVVKEKKPQPKIITLSRRTN